MTRRLTLRYPVAPQRFPWQRVRGEMSEWLKEHAWKACVGVTPPRVRIPLSPPPASTLADLAGRFDPLALDPGPGRQVLKAGHIGLHGSGWMLMSNAIGLEAFCQDTACWVVSENPGNPTRQVVPRAARGRNRGRGRVAAGSRGEARSFGGQVSHSQGRSLRIRVSPLPAGRCSVREGT